MSDGALHLGTPLAAPQCVCRTFALSNERWQIIWICSKVFGRVATSMGDPTRSSWDTSTKSWTDFQPVVAHPCFMSQNSNSHNSGGQRWQRTTAVATKAAHCAIKHVPNTHSLDNVSVQLSHGAAICCDSRCLLEFKLA